MLNASRFGARLADFSRLFSAARFDPVIYFRSFPSWLPFKLGESVADASIPYVLSGDLAEVTEQAAADILDLFKRRREGELPREVTIAFEEQPRKLSAFRPYPGRLAESSVLHAVVERALRLDPLLDAGLMESWLSRGAPGGRLVEALYALYNQAVEADLASGASTPYLYVVALALVEQVESLKRLAKAVQIRNVGYERLEKAFGMAFYAVFATLLERMLEALPSRQLPFEVETYSLRIRLALNPLLFISIRKSVLINDVNAYGITARLADVLDPVYGELLDQEPDPRGIERRLVRHLQEETSLGDLAEAEGGQQLLREAVRGFLARFDAFDEDLTGLLIPTLARDDELGALRERAKEVLGRLGPLEGRNLNAAESTALQDLRQALRGAFSREVLIRVAAQSFLTLALDRFAAEHLDAARGRLRNRRQEGPVERLEAEFAQGKLYRFGGDGRPFLRQLTRAQEAHLFIDLKGFTQRTYRAKEVVMADFLRSEFYGPILKAAGRYLAGGTPDGQPILVLQNLLGDAAVFSGDVRVLLRLAREIQQILVTYGEKLRQRLGSVATEAEAKKRALNVDAEGTARRLRAESTQLDAELGRKRRLGATKQEEALWDLYARRLFALERRRSEAEAAGLGNDVERFRRGETLLREERRLLEEAMTDLPVDERRARVDERLCAPERLRLAEIARELQGLKENTRVALRALDEEARIAGGHGLEAGLFVTYGAMAEVVTLDDAGFGSVKVAIAEKINEAARGTARSSHIRAKLDALVEQARVHNPALGLPFNVYVDQTYSAVLSPGLTQLVDAAVAERDANKMREAARQLAENLVQDMTRMVGQGEARATPFLTVLNDIYNVGEAFSVEAVDAFISGTRTMRIAVRKGLSVADLHPDFHQRFVFPTDALQLWISVPLSGELGDAIVFRLAGHVHFRGFEAKQATAVYELLRQDSEFSRLLAQHHLRDWVIEARAVPNPAR